MPRMLLATILGFLVPVLPAQEDSKVVASGEIGPYATVKTSLFAVSGDESITVENTGNPGQTYLITEVYDEKSELLEKQPEVNPAQAQPFKWSPGYASRYYLRIRNLAEGQTSYKVVARIDKQYRGSPQIPNIAVMRVYYATNRSRTGSPQPESYYGSELESNDKLNYGELDVSLPRDLTHKMGELEGPTVFRVFRVVFGANPDPSTQFLVTRILPPENRDLFLARVAQRVRVAERKQVLVFVHGFNVSFEEAACRTAQLAYDLKYDGAPILFSWPSHGAPRVSKQIPTLSQYLLANIPSLQEYLKDGEYNGQSVTVFEQFLTDVRTRTGAEKIHVIAHSMGNRLLTSALTDLASKSPPSRPFRVNEVVFMAPDVPTFAFRAQAPKFSPAGSRLTLYASSTDRALQAAQKLSGGPRAGQGGKNIVVLPGIDSIDASLVDTGLLGLNHGYYADRTSIIYDLDQLIHGVPASRRLDLHEVPDQRGSYWKFGAVGK